MVPWLHHLLFVNLGQISVTPLLGLPGQMSKTFSDLLCTIEIPVGYLCVTWQFLEYRRGPAGAVCTIESP